MGARTCTQPLSELATASVGCVEVPEPISGRRRRVWGSWYLQTMHASDHCDVDLCMAVHGANLHPSCKLAWHLQTAQVNERNRTNLRSEFQSTCIGLCLPSAALQCDLATIACCLSIEAPHLERIRKIWVGDPSLGVCLPRFHRHLLVGQ